MGAQTNSNQNQVYFDTDANQYYTMSGQPQQNYYGSGFINNNRNQGQRNYLGEVLGNINNKSMVDQMIQRAQMASQNANVPNVADLFPYMNTNYQPYAQQQAPMMQTPSAPMQSSGAGRFLNAGNNTNAPALNYGVNTVA